MFSFNMLSLWTPWTFTYVKSTPSLYMHYTLEPGAVTSTCFHCHCSLITYVYFYSTDEHRVRTLMLADIDDVHVFAQAFLTSGIRQRIHWCSSAYRAMLMSGDVTTLPHLPLALFFCTQSFYSTSTFVTVCPTACTHSIW